MKRERRRPGARKNLALGVVLGFVALALLGPLLSPFSPSAIDLGHELEGPSGSHWLGTAENGVDILSILLSGARSSATVAFLSVGLASSIGLFLGVLSGYLGGVSDHLVGGLADLLQAFPSIVLHIVFLALVERPTLVHVAVALSLNGWVLFARIARAETLLLREREFLTAARALGVKEHLVVLRHVLPNIAGPLLIQGSGALGGAVVAEASLAFLGLGPGTGLSWGALLDQGAGLLLRFPHVAIAPGIAIVITVLGFHGTGDWLRDRLDPRTRNSR
jgi:peptide/nickel transport system permease protein